MAAVTTVQRVLLLSPQRLLTDYILLQLLHIKKSKQVVDYKIHAATDAELGNCFSHLPGQAIDTLRQFIETAMVRSGDQIKKQYHAQRAGISAETYYRRAMTRSLHGLFERIKPFAELVKWYHQVEHRKGHFRTGPCSFSTYKPALQFSVTKEHGRLAIDTVINLNGSVYPLGEFNRYLFLLESKNEYFILSFKDYQTLEWLGTDDIRQFANQPDDFSKHVLARLEADYPVNRNDIFARKEIEAAAVNRVMLSEISGTFLVLTPQWLYDGLLVEGAWKDKHEITRNGELYVIKRNRETETAFLQRLEQLHPNFSKQLNGYYYLSFADAQRKQWFLKAYHKLLEENIQFAGMDMLQHFRYSPHPVKVAITLINKEETMLSFNMNVSFGDEVVSLAEVQKILLANQRHVLLKDGSIGILNDDWMVKHGTIIRHGKIANTEIKVARWLAFEQKTDTDGCEMKQVLPETWWHKWRKWQDGNEPIYAVPESIKATLRPYQQKGFEWMLLLSEAGAGGCLADDMGLGKTLQTICFLAHQLAKKPASRFLIVSPSSLIFNWQQELSKFAPHISTCIYHGIARTIENITNESASVIITSYGTVRSDIEVLKDISFDIAVLDESHHIKNPSALVTRAVSLLKATTRMALSGTPVMNNTFDLYAQVNFLLPGIFGNREFFKREYAEAIDRDRDPEKIKALKKLTAPFILRRTKQQVADDLPAKSEMVMWCTMKPAQKMLYDEIKTNIRNSLFLNIKSDGLNKNKLAILQGILKLRQVCNSPLLLPQQEQTCSDSVKSDLLMEELCNNLQDHKVLVFSQFSSMLHLLAAACEQRGIAFYHFDGQTPPAKRAEMVTRFQEEGNPVNVFLISLKAGNAGLNLTAADYVFLFDPWWNTAVQQQAIDRTHRIGQTKNVFAYKMICKDTIEEKILELQKRKNNLAEDLVSEDEGFLKSLTQEETEYLFS
jgi:superfamily II DNA or RNA helicase